MTAPHQLHTTLRTLKLSGMLDTLDARLAQARAGDLGHLEFLQVLCEDEITRRAAFALIHGTPVPGYEAPVEVTGPAAGRIAAVMLEVFAGAVRAGAADPARTQVPPELPIGQLLHELLGESGSDQSAWLACIGLNAWASLRGFLSAEIFGSLSGLVSDTDQLYRAHVRTVMTGMGFEPALIDAADTDREPRPATQST